MTQAETAEPTATTADDDDGPPARFGPWRRELRSYLELLAVFGVAFAQPTLDILSKNSTVFISRRTTPVQLVAFTLLVVLVPALGAWVVEVVSGLLLPRVRRYVHALLCGAAVGVLAVEVLKKQTELTSSRLVAVGVVLGLVAAAVVWKFAIVRLWLRYLAFAPAAFAALFLFFSPVTSVVFDEGPAAANGVKVGKPTRVVMVVMDEFALESLLDGNGRIDSTLYPHFAELAGTSTWYRNTTTVAPYTQIAVPAILSGDKPESVPPAVAAVYPHNLFTLLGDSYEMNVHESVTRLCPSSICGATQQAAAHGHSGFRGLVDDAWSAWKQFASPERKSQTINFSVGQSPSDAKALVKGDEFVRSLVPATRPRLDFLHVLLPHQPWHYIGSGQDNTNIDHGVRGLSFYNWYNQQTADLGRVRHLEQVQAADHLLGQIIAKLKRIGAWDDSIFVLTADHGVAFTPQSSIRGASAENYDQIMWTPFFVKTARQTAPVVDDRVVESVDVFPTVADLLDTKLPWKIDGRSVLHGPARPAATRPLFEWTLNRLQPEPGSKYIEVDGPAGFSRMLEGRASSSTADPALRIYQPGPYGGLVGQEAAPLVVDDGPTKSCAVDEAQRYTDIDPKRHDVPWQYVSGTCDILEMGRPMAVALNGRIAGIGTTWWTTFATRSDFWASLAPSLARKGRNEVRIYSISGPADAPRLAPVRVGD